MTFSDLLDRLSHEALLDLAVSLRNAYRAQWAKLEIDYYTALDDVEIPSVVDYESLRIIRNSLSQTRSQVRITAPEPTWEERQAAIASRRNRIRGALEDIDLTSDDQVDAVAQVLQIKA